jgi:signal transduction histidine kinase
MLSRASALEPHADGAPRLTSARILELTADGVVALDNAGRITYANPAAADILGTPPEHLVDQFLHTYLLLGRNAPDTGDATCWREDGSQLTVEYHRTDAIADGGVVGTVITLRDVSQQRLRARTRDELLSIASHELRSPLSSVRSALATLAGGLVGPVSDRGQRMLEIAMASADRLIRLVNDVLDLERLEAGQVPLSRVECRAADLMAQAVADLQAMADDVDVRLEIAPNSAVVNGDRDRLVQVLVNLVANAIKFSPPQGGTVWLTATADGGEVIFRVRDEGKGIPTERLESIFERFAQIEDGDPRRKTGTGLGLAISRTIVEHHGGQIWAESLVGAGTTMCVALPRGDERA